jgi:hypothetical protein
MMKAVHAVVGLCALASLAVPAAAQKQGIHEDTKKGFRLKVPEKWTTIPVQIDEKWIVAKFLSNRSYETKSRGATGGGEHKPKIYVIEFDDEARKLKVEEERHGDTTIYAKNSPYRDYKDYLKRNVGDGGWYIDKEEKGTEAGVPCTKFQVRIEKGTELKRRLITWLFRGEKGEIAVECEVLEDHFEKLEPQMLAALKSFKLIPRTTVDATAAITGENGGDKMWVTDRRLWKELPVEERQRRRKRIEAERMEKSQENLLKGWTPKRTKHYLVLSHADAKYTKTIIDAAETYRTWLEENFDSLSDEYVMHGIIRICADLDEARAYADTSRNSDSFNQDNREVVIWQDKSEGNAGINWSRLFRGIFAQYLIDKDELVVYMPSWMQVGLFNYVGGSQIKLGKLVNEPSDMENNAIREVERAGAFAALKDLMGAKTEEGMKVSTDAERTAAWQWAAQTSRLVRYMYGPGAKTPQLKDFVVNYIKGTITLAESMEAERRQGRAAATTEEEEKANNDEDKAYWQRRRTEILLQLEKDRGWDDATWAAIQKAFHEYLKKA